MANSYTSTISDPYIQRFTGYSYGHEFDVPFISHIEGNLYQGGCKDGLVLPESIDHVFALYAKKPYIIQNRPGKPPVQVTEVLMNDVDVMPPFSTVLSLARDVHEACGKGRTLVHCEAGLNRSGLIAGATLVLSGYSPEQAIWLLRHKRSPAVLTNPSFHKFLIGFRPNSPVVGSA